MVIGLGVVFDMVVWDMVVNGFYLEEDELLMCRYLAPDRVYYLLSAINIYSLASLEYLFHVPFYHFGKHRYRSYNYQKGIKL